MAQFKKFKDIMALMTYLEELGFNIAVLNKTINTYNDALFSVRDLVGRSFYYDEPNRKFVLQKQPDSRKPKLLRYATGAMLIAHGAVTTRNTSQHYVIEMKDVSLDPGTTVVEDVFRWAAKELQCDGYRIEYSKDEYSVTFFFPV